MFLPESLQPVLDQGQTAILLTLLGCCNNAVTAPRR